MFPLDPTTQYLQSAAEAEHDVGVLVLAMRSVPTGVQHVVAKYVTVAVLSFVDALEDVFTKDQGNLWERFPKVTPLGQDIITARKEYQRAKGEIVGWLHETVRNRGAAHKEPYYVETEAELMRTLNSRDGARLFRLGREVMDYLAACPIWAWGYSYPGGGIGAFLCACTRPLPADPNAVEPPDGFGTRGVDALGPAVDSANIVVEMRFQTLAEAKRWAENRRNR